METDESRLLERARGGDDAAFSELALRYKDRLFGIAAGVCARMPSETDDVVQDTLISAFRHIGSFRANAAFSTWLYRIAANNCWQRMRKVKSERLSPLPDENSSDHPSRSCVNENAVKDELSAAVSRALSSLPAPYRLAVTLCDIEGRKNSEAAAMLGLSLPALKARLHRGRLMLQKQLSSFR